MDTDCSRVLSIDDHPLVLEGVPAFRLPIMNLNLVVSQVAELKIDTMAIHRVYVWGGITS